MNTERIKEIQQSTAVSGWRSFKEEKPLDAQRYYYSQGSFFLQVYGLMN
jgi:hypothetical protein